MMNGVNHNDETGISGRMDERRCLKPQMNGSDSERWRGLLQKKRGASTESRDEDSRRVGGVKTVMNVLHCTIFLGQCRSISTVDMGEM